MSKIKIEKSNTTYLEALEQAWKISQEIDPKINHLELDDDKKYYIFRYFIVSQVF